MQQYRYFLKDTIRKHIDFSKTDQNRGIEAPPVKKPFADDAVITELPKPHALKDIPAIRLSDAIKNRKSRRAFLKKPLSLEELSFLLWATQGIRHVVDRGHAYRTVPSGGYRHALETYLCVFNIEGLRSGVYRYLPLEHRLLFEFTDDRLKEKSDKCRIMPTDKFLFFVSRNTESRRIYKDEVQHSRMTSNELVNFDEPVGSHMRTDLRFLGDRFLKN